MGEDDLTDLLGAETLGVDEAVGDAAGGTLGAGFDAADEHDARIPRISHCINVSGQYVFITSGLMDEIRKSGRNPAESAQTEG